MTSGPPSFSPSCARLGDFLYLTARQPCLFRSQYKHVRLVFALEPVEVRLTCQLFVRIVVVLPLREHIIDQPDGQQVEVSDADTELYTAQQKERGGHFPLTFSRFFLDSTSVCTFRPHSSIS
mgnify:FL=1